jgi:Zn-dependent peptidase ImmA (M78 family)/DNA-binding XRE family transcriptional regulator
MTTLLRPVSHEKFNAAMLQLARAARGLTQEEAANAAGVTQALLSKLENRLQENPSDDVVEALAKTLHFPVAFFHQSDGLIGLPHFHHRKRTKLQAKPLARIHAVINIRRMHLQRLLRSWEREPLKPIPELDPGHIGLDAQALALRMREYWLLPRGPVDNLVDLIEASGGVVILTDFNTSLIDGISIRTPGLPPIFFMNSQVPADRFRYSLAHELGHMIMHSVPGDDEIMECQADEFAASFLMPAQDVRPYLTAVSIAKLGRVKPFWKVSIKALIRRAFDLKLMTPYQYKSLNIEYSKARYNNGEPHPIEFEKPKLLVQLVEHHMRTLGYSITEMAQLLCIHEDDFRKVYLPGAKGLRLVVSNR